MNLSLEGRNAIICGSTQGIGLAIAQELALMGASCTLVARNAESLSEAILQLDSTLQQQHGYLVADFSNPEEVRNMIHEHVQKLVVHILVNNTGGPPAGPIVDATEEAFLAAFNQHLICNHILTKAVVPGMKIEQFGRIVNIVSTSVKVPIANLGVSNTIRGAVASWAKTMANELGEYQITVNNVLPGLTTTQRLESLVKTTAGKSGVSEANVKEQMLKEIPARRFADPAEVAAVAAFLASPAAAYVNGVSIAVDGGKTGSI
ncbi:SDR family oxidoreductase [Segetibacter sp. 3557_3]|uniref:SDR family oxidoreductase n=1 Tax=Segetibacter sp. 3557_3 TaxID=2547429 RepID=UPI001058DED7|nr:SDR family oxidoreductase [Segetibacter sp. 3557_3]TDH25584.1 SDR family oxidoreductase [Segetibacter sp. 3557_3]